MSEKRVKTGLAVTPGHLKLCDENLRRARVSSRNDFVEEAIEFYAAHLLSRDIPHLWDPPPKTEDVPMERFESLCHSLGTGQYKLSVEVATLARLLSRALEIPEREIRETEAECAREVRKLGSAPTFLQNYQRERSGKPYSEE